MTRTDSQSSPVIATETRPPATDWIFFGTLAVALFPLAVVTYNHLGEDAFITFRYLRNLVAGRGLTFNAGEHVEGYSNLLWVLLLTPFEALGVRQHVAARLLSVTFYAGLILCAGWAVRQITASTAPAWLRWWLPLALFLEPLLHYHLDRGLETVSFAVLLGAAVLVSGARVSPWVAGTIAAFATISRPEGIGFATALAPVLILSEYRDSKEIKAAIRRAATYMALPTAFFAAQLVFRYVTYGEFVPNTVIAKSEGGPGGMREVLALTLSHALLPLFGLLGCVLALRRSETSTLALGALLQWVAALGFQLVAGGLLNIGFRYLVPILVPSVIGTWLLLYVITVTWIESDAGEGKRHLPLLIATPLLLIVSLLIYKPGNRYFTGNEDAPRSRFHCRLFEKESWRLGERWEWYLRDPIFLNASAGRWLRQNLPPKATLALDQMGQVGFYAGEEQTIIDVLGLMDAYVARNGVNAAYLEQRGVEFVVVESFADDSYWPADWRLQPRVPGLREFINSTEFQQGWELKWVLSSRADMKIVFAVWARSASPTGKPETVPIGVPNEEFEHWWRVL